MSFKEKNVRLVVGQVGKEKPPLFQGGLPEGSMIPNDAFKYEIMVGQDMHKLVSINQRFMVNGFATIMLDDAGKAELMYHKLGINSAPFNLNNPVFAEFFGGTSPNELSATFYTKKFKLFGGGTKKIEKAMAAGQAGTRTEALIMKFETGMEVHTPGKTSITAILTLLVKDPAGGYFITTAKGKIKGTRKHGFENSPILGAGVNITYDPNNRAVAIIDQQ